MLTQDRIMVQDPEEFIVIVDDEDGDDIEFDWVLSEPSVPFVYQESVAAEFTWLSIAEVPRDPILDGEVLKCFVGDAGGHIGVVTWHLEVSQ